MPVEFHKRDPKQPLRVVIMGAAGRDFHNFNVFFRDNGHYEVVCFTAAQIPDIAGRKYPPVLAGKLYPKGIPIHPEEEVAELIRKHNVDRVVLAYSDLSFDEVMTKASIVLAAGADFTVMGPDSTMLESRKPVISVCAVRTGCGKSQTTREVANILKQMGKKVAIVRHPMPYGDLAKQAVQKFESFKDLDKHECTIEEREEYEGHLEQGFTVYAGVDYEKILRLAEKDADFILWDGGNNDLPFYKPDLHIVLTDPYRPGHELEYYPGEANLRMADVALINKISPSVEKNARIVEKNIKSVNPSAVIIKAASEIEVDRQELVKGKRVLVVEDGPTLTHGGMSYGAGFLAAKKYGAKEIVKPAQYAVGSIKKVYEKFKQLHLILPAMGYGKTQLKELEETINKADCDTVIAGTPMNLRQVIKVNKPVVRVKYYLKELTKPTLKDLITKQFK